MCNSFVLFKNSGTIVKSSNELSKQTNINEFKLRVYNIIIIYYYLRWVNSVSKLLTYLLKIWFTNSSY